MKFHNKILALSLALFLFIIPVLNVSATNLTTDNEIQLSTLTWEELMNMDNETFTKVLLQFEKEYDPFHTYGTDKQIVNSNNITSYIWTSGDPENGKQGTHALITAKACGIMLNDKGFWGQNKNASILMALSLSLCSILPDKQKTERDSTDNGHGTINYGHFYDPDTNSAPNNFPYNAKTNTLYFYNKAKQEYRTHGLSENFYIYLGRCVHYIQDVAVPFHSANNLGLRHLQFELYVEQNIETYIINPLTTMSEQEYSFAQYYSPDVLCHNVAVYSKPMFNTVNTFFVNNSYKNVAKNTAIKATTSTTQLVYKISKELNISLHKG